MPKWEYPQSEEDAPPSFDEIDKNGNCDEQAAAPLLKAVHC